MKRSDLLKTISEDKSSSFYEAIGDAVAYAQTVGEAKSNIDTMQKELTAARLKMEDMDDGEILE